jgi:hypothetical protein
LPQSPLVIDDDFDFNVDLGFLSDV